MTSHESNPYHGPEHSEESRKFDEAQVIQHNIKMMNTEMKQVLMTESIGGNAGEIEIEGKICPCAGANGYMNETGKILAFGNVQYLDESITRNNLHFIIKVAYSPVFTILKIVSVDIYGKGSELASRILNQSVDEWNKSIHPK